MAVETGGRVGAVDGDSLEGRRTGRVGRGME